MKSIRFILIAAISCFIQNGFSQTTNIDTSKMATLGEVVVSVNKTAEVKKYVAQQVQVMYANQIANLQSQTTADLLANSGNVFIQKSQLGGGSVTIRGFEANRNVLVIDGVRMNNLIYRGGHLHNIVTTDNNSLERVEILFGPSSTIYGSDALGGVVHLYTKKAQLASDNQTTNLKVNALTRYGSVNKEITNHLDVNYGTKKFASLTSFTHSRFGDLMGGKNQNPFYTGKYGERPYYVQRINGKDSLVKNSNRYLQVGSGYTQYDVLQKFTYKQNEHATHGLNLQYSTSTDVPRYDRLTDPSGAGLRFAEWYYGPQTRLLAAYDVNVNNNAVTFQSIHAGVNFQKVKESRHTRRFGNDSRQNRIENVNVLGANVDFLRKYKNHQIRFGLDAQFNTLKSTANEENISLGSSKPLDTRYPDGDNNMLNAAAYFSHTWRIHDELVMTDGLRAGFISLHSTFVDTSFFSFPYNKADQNNFVYSGSFGFISTPSDDVKLSLMVSTGFRAPNVDDLSKVFSSAPSSLIVPNKNLKPEKTINYELGVTRVFNNKTSWENVVYYTDFKDAIVTDKFQYNGQDSVIYEGVKSQVFANQNKRSAYVFGFSSNIKSQWSNHLLFSMAFNYTYGRIKTDSFDSPLDHIPPFMARMQLSYTNKKCNADFFVNYNGGKSLKNYYLNGEDNEQYATPEGMPAWFTTNFRASYQLHKFITLQAGVDNIFDTQYRTFASGINAPGRNMFAAIRLHY